MPPFARPVRAAVLDALALVLPVDCAGCGAPDRSVCDACRAALAPAPVRTSRAVLGGTDGIAVWAGLEYAGIASSVIRSMKDAQRTDAAAALAPALRAALAAACRDPVGGMPPTRLEIAAVPSTRAARCERGYEPVRLLLGRAGFRAPAVLRTREGRLDQAHLGREARRANAAGSLAPLRRLDGRTFLVVDDVVTTGSTLAEAVRAIRSAGGTVHAAAVVAHTPRRVPEISLPVGERPVTSAGGRTTVSGQAWSNHPSNPGDTPVDGGRHGTEHRRTQPGSDRSIPRLRG
ncbi:ComF family protein [Agromyces sp. NDB4Y10]|uniref:ComF family protein n=1 Tax=Agromyces sp. NDB4Y10 TaxID=1775951 RepID=UPI000835FFB2|nr:phosphoribosyltransferase family protein [Agromyces sp. NDB4Y10]